MGFRVGHTAAIIFVCFEASRCLQSKSLHVFENTEGFKHKTIVFNYTI